MRSEFSPAVTADMADYVIANMREQDRDEIWAANRLTPRDAIRQGVRDSVFLWCVLVGGLPAAICGVAPLGHPTSHFGVPWLLGTDDLVRAPVSFFRGSRRALESVYPRYTHLVNFVDARNVVSLKWLRWLGFRILEPREYGVDRRPFHLVEKEF